MADRYLVQGRFPAVIVTVDEGKIIDAPEPIRVMLWKNWSKASEDMARWGWVVTQIEEIDFMLPEEQA